MVSFVEGVFIAHINAVAFLCWCSFSVESSGDSMLAVTSPVVSLLSTSVGTVDCHLKWSSY